MAAPESGDSVPDLLRAGRRRGRHAGVLLVAGSVATLLLVRTMTDDVHRVMFAVLGVALAVAAITIVVLTER